MLSVIDSFSGMFVKIACDRRYLYVCGTHFAISMVGLVHTSTLSCVTAGMTTTAPSALARHSRTSDADATASHRASATPPDDVDSRLVCSRERARCHA